MNEPVKITNNSDKTNGGYIAKAIRVFDRIIDSFAICSAVLMAFILVAVNSEVVARNFIGAPIIWVTEVTEYSQVWLTFLASAWVLKKGGHVVMDIGISKFKPSVQTYFNAITSIVGVLVCLTMTFFGAKVTLDLFLRQVPLATPIMPPASILFIIIPIGSFLLALQFIRRSYGFFLLRKTNIS